MFTRYLTISTVAACLLLTACLKDEQPAVPDPVIDKAPIIEQETQPVIPETKDVTYEGTIRPAGISIYQEGTHRIILEDSSFVLLESDDVDLNGYVDEQATVIGAVRPTVEDGGMIMRVESISVVEVDESQQDDTDTDTTTVEVEDKDIINDEVEIKEDPAGENKIPVDTNDEDKAMNDEKLQDTSEPAEPTAVTPEQKARIATMARDSYGPERWTEQYCTSHVGFCVPVHRNWWYHSFGAAGSSLWHLEFSNADVLQNVGDGEIALRLLPGSLRSTGKNNGPAELHNGSAIAYASWNDKSHFAVSADKSLAIAVEYLAQNIKAFVKPE